MLNIFCNGTAMTTCTRNTLKGSIAQINHYSVKSFMSRLFPSTPSVSPSSPENALSPPHIFRPVLTPSPASSPIAPKKVTRRIYGISDLHLEFYPNHTALWKTLERSLPDADIAVLAGDIGIPANGKEGEYASLLRKFKQKYPDVVLVPGNHEYYRTKFYNRTAVKDDLREICADTGVVLLDNSSAVVQNVRFFGTTMWSNADQSVGYGLNDIGKVFPSVDDYNEEHRACITWLKNELNDNANTVDNVDTTDNCVVVTHHLPTFKLAHPRFSGYSKFNTAFYTELLQDLNIKKVSLWFCGHTHEHSTHKHKKDNGEFLTIVVNPNGYPKEYRETKTSFDTYNIEVTEKPLQQSTSQNTMQSNQQLQNQNGGIMDGFIMASMMNNNSQTVHHTHTSYPTSSTSSNSKDEKEPKKKNEKEEDRCDDDVGVDYDHTPKIRNVVITEHQQNDFYNTGSNVSSNRDTFDNDADNADSYNSSDSWGGDSGGGSDFGSSD
ncbi:metallophosphoesterase [Yasminevirus sp. GU-2018]|uniref:Metallophosphoesterase n=1 Tax=Yasminevirus sp. GU-2018 TaxID=2420051 RepID=A0A5K0UC87_9VIRU|nr:metallophosphoesterase [Yasminevirus sp. GU-2018]